MDIQSDDTLRSQPSAFSKFFKSISQRYQKLLDTSTPHVAGRWIFAVLLVIGYMARVLYLQGWYIITYALGIYYLNLFIAFLTPKIDPALNDDL
ncbi:golgi proteininvolved in ER retention-like protein, partial [Dinothrombium tinctorium]